MQSVISLSFIILVIFTKNYKKKERKEVKHKPIRAPQRIPLSRDISSYLQVSVSANGYLFF